MLSINQIYNMDCLEGMKQIDDKSIDMILCDLPYGVTICEWDSIIDNQQEYRRILKPNRAIVLTAQQPFTSKLIIDNLDLFKYEFIWEKENGSGFLDANRKPLRSHENILIFLNGSLKTSIYNPQFEKGKPYTCKQGSPQSTYGRPSKDSHTTVNEGIRYPKTILRFNRDKKDIFHPTQKPVSLFEYLIKTYSNENDLILDNCMGSGTTAVACIQSKRNFIGFELNKEYFDKAQERVLNYQRKEVLAIENWF